jgi:hypothetical protein
MKILYVCKDIELYEFCFASVFGGRENKTRDISNKLKGKSDEAI